MVHKIFRGRFACVTLMDHFRHLILKARSDRVEELGKILPSVFRQHFRGNSPAVVEVLAPLWVQIVGAQLAEHCRPAGFEAGTLVLATACPSWAAQLRQMTEEIRARVNSYLGAPVARRVRIREVLRLDLIEEAHPLAGGHRGGELFAAPRIGGLEPGMNRVAGRPSLRHWAGHGRMER